MTSLVQWFNRSSEYEIDGRNSPSKLSVRQKSRGSRRTTYEHGHSNRDESKEVARQAYIENQLGCRFLRFNPDAKDFCIYGTINELMRMVYDA
jgi:hypothetical protein